MLFGGLEVSKGGKHIRRTNKNRISWGSFQDNLFWFKQFPFDLEIFFGVRWRILSTTKESNLRRLNQEQVFQVGPQDKPHMTHANEQLVLPGIKGENSY